MNGKASKAKAGAYDVLMPRLKREGAGVVFAAGSFIRRSGVVPAALMAARLPGGSIGVHAAENGGSHSLCNLPLAASPSGKATEAVVSDAAKTRQAATRVAQSVTCKFCATRLVACGVLTADNMSSAMPADSKAYALDYGSRNAEAELLAIETRAAEAKAAAEAAAAKAAAEAKREAAKAKRAAKAKA